MAWQIQNGVATITIFFLQTFVITFYDLTVILLRTRPEEIKLKKTQRLNRVFEYYVSNLMSEMFNRFLYNFYKTGPSTIYE